MVKSSELEVTYAVPSPGELIATWWHPATRQRLTVVVRDYSSPFVLPPGPRREVTFRYPASVSVGGVLVAGKPFTISSVPDADVYFEQPTECVWPEGPVHHLLDHHLTYHEAVVDVDYFAVRGMA